MTIKNAWGWYKTNYAFHIGGPAWLMQIVFGLFVIIGFIVGRIL